jgi:hypothetical protein
MPTLDEALAAIREFRPRLRDSLGGGERELERLGGEFRQELPLDVRDYVARAAPRTTVELQGPGNPVRLLSASELRANPVGYGQDAAGALLSGWSEGWLLIGDEGGDPIIVDLDQPERGVLSAFHGGGAWEFDPIGDSVASWLVCAAAVDFALEEFDGETLIDEEDQLRLADAPAQWLRPILSAWAGKQKPAVLASLGLDPVPLSKAGSGRGHDRASYFGRGQPAEVLTPLSKAGPRRKYHRPRYFGRGPLADVLATGSPDEVCSVLLGMALEDKDPGFILTTLLDVLADGERESPVRLTAITSLAHLVRLHHAEAPALLDSAPRLEVLAELHDAELGRFDDVLDDAGVFSPESVPLLKAALGR